MKPAKPKVFVNNGEVSTAVPLRVKGLPKVKEEPMEESPEIQEYENIGEDLSQEEKENIKGNPATSTIKQPYILLQISLRKQCRTCMDATAASDQVLHYLRLDSVVQLDTHLTDDQVAGLIHTRSGNILCWRLIMK